MSHELTAGQVACGVDSNPGGRRDVAEVKAQFADLYDRVYTNMVAGGLERQAALQAIVAAQMWTVKVLTRSA